MVGDEKDDSTEVASFQGNEKCAIGPFPVSSYISCELKLILLIAAGEEEKKLRK